MRGPRALGLLLGLLLAACGEGDPAPAPVDDDPPPRAHGHGTHDPGHGGPRPEAPPARLARLSGTVTVDGAAARAGVGVDAEATVEVPADGTAVLVLRDGARLELEPGAIARVVTQGPAQVLLVRGGGFVTQPAAGNSARPPLRVATPAGTLEIGGSGSAYVAAFGNGTAWVAALDGAATVSTGEADSRRRLRETELAQGQAVAVAGRIAEPTEGPARLPAARAASAALAAGEGVGEGDPEAGARGLAAEVERLDQALRWLETETRHGGELTAQHRAAVQASEQDESRRLQRELVAHSQELYRLRRLAHARWERVRAQRLWLGLLDAAPSPDPVAARADRVAGLLGF